MKNKISFSIQARDQEFGLILSSPILTSDCSVNCTQIQNSIRQLKEQIEELNLPVSQLFFKASFNECPSNEIIQYFKEKGL